MFSLLFAFLFKAFLPAILLLALVDWLTMSRDRKARTLRRQGLSFAKIAARLGCSPTTARRLCLAAI
jgi:ABC-type dipeptide/oligopeptide/nickel transport system permease subunit